MVEMEFDLMTDNPEKGLIKILGVGGGGSNAVEHMKRQGVEGVTFIVSNTDEQDLHNSNISNRIQLGPKVTEGLGAGAKPDIGREAANESAAEIKQVLGNDTKILFITAGMGGGTGTGAAPVIARIAKEMEILTVGIVTYPFKFESKMKSLLADQGIKEMREHVDSMIVIKNQVLMRMYPDFAITQAYAKVDDVVCTAAKTLSEIITKHYDVNIDLNDAITVLENSGTAIIGLGVGEGTDRSLIAIKSAIDSPLLDNQSIQGAKSVMFSMLAHPETPITVSEMSKISDFITEQAGDNDEFNPIHGIGEDDTIEKGQLKVTIVATGFEQNALGNRDEPPMPRQVSHTDDYVPPHKQKIEKFGNTIPHSHGIGEIESRLKKRTPTPNSGDMPSPQSMKYRVQSTRPKDTNELPQNSSVDPIHGKVSRPITTNEFDIKTQPPKPKPITNPIYRPISELEDTDRSQFQSDFDTDTGVSDVLERLESEPAYKRRNINLTPDQYSRPSDTSINIDEETNEVQIRKGGRFLDKDID